LQWDFTLAPRISPNGTVNQNSGNNPDSVVVVNGQTIRYYSPGVTYQFNQANTAAVLDTVRLYTTSATPDGCGSTNQQLVFPIRVFSKPVAQFNFLSSGCINDSVRLFTQSTIGQGKITNWRWNSGSGVSTIKNDSSYQGFKYAAAGTYSLSHDVISEIGCVSDPMTKTLTIQTKPTAGWVVPAVACINAVVTFSDVSVAPDGTIASRIWNLDDGNGSFTRTTNASVQTTFSSWGDKVPTLQVILSNGCTSDVFSPSTPLRIHPLPEPGFIPPAICLNDANAIFQDTSKIADGSIGFTYLWNFNFAMPAISPGPVPLTSTLAQPTVTYNKEDNYQVRLQVTSAAGCTAAITRSFTVNGTTPRADFNILNGLPFCSSQPITIKDLSSVNFGALTQLQIYWDVTRDRTKRTQITVPASQQEYIRSFTDVTGNAPVSFSVRLVAYSGGNNCADSVTKIIQVFPTPVAAFTASATSICSGDDIVFTDLSNGKSSAVQQWFWDLGKGQSSSLGSPTATYSDSGNVVVKLYIKNADGCFSDTAFLPITIHPLPVLILPAEQRILEGAIVPLKPDFVFGNNLSYLWTPATYLSSDTAANPLCSPTDDLLYTLQVTSQAGCSVTDEMQVKVLKEPSVPNAFSPNGDGINDFWVIKSLEFYPDATIQIFNRYGQPVYLSTGYSQPWNGKFKGVDLPVGTYYYIINPKNGRNIIKGAVTIIR
jgi:gliding motility-associated-like protein